MSDELRKFFLDTYGINYKVFKYWKDLMEEGHEHGTYNTTDTGEIQIYHFSKLEIEKAEDRLNTRNIS